MMADRVSKQTTSGKPMSFGEFSKKFNLYWIGPRESDIDAVKSIFAGSITFFGNGESNGYRDDAGVPEGCRGNHTMSRSAKIDHNDLGDKSMDIFVHDQVMRICEADPLARFYMYNANVLRINDGQSSLDDGTHIRDEIIKERYICLNDNDTMKAMDSKKTFHNLLVRELGEENLLDIHICKGKLIDSYHTLCQQFDVDPFTNTRFIVQEVFASGGAGTHIVSKPRHGEGLSFKPDDDYLCSILQEDNLSVNAHIVIFDDEILLLPPSIQIIRENNNRLMYRGADYVTYNDIAEGLRKKFEDLCATVAAKYQKGFSVNEAGQENNYKPYRGVLGLDALIHNGKIEMLECNNRFQSSSNLLNVALTEAGMPSLQEINYYACNHGAIKDSGLKASVNTSEFGDVEYKTVVGLEVRLSNFGFVDSGSNIVHAKRIFGTAQRLIAAGEPGNILALERDGYEENGSYKSFSHLFRISFKTNITSLSPEGTLRLNENICEPKRSWMDKIYDFDPLATKIALLVQGLAQGAENANYREATNNAVDLRLKKPLSVSAPNYTELVVNTPLDVKFVEFSPFELTVAGDKRYCLKYYDRAINDNVLTFEKDELATRVTKNNVPYNKIAFASGDRLRVHVSDKCVFKKQGKQCKFCNMDADNDCAPDFTEEDVREVVQAYWDMRERYGLEHFLIGGQSPDGDAQEKVVKTARIIKKITGSDRIYAMILPPTGGSGSGNKAVIEKILGMVKAGVTEFAFNMEIYDDDRAKKYMPGKAGGISRDEYLTALNIARYVIDDKYTENVRTMFVVGLESYASLKQGLRLVIENGIQPMLSVFRPLPKTDLYDYTPPRLDDLYELYGVVEKWCEEKGIHLGPHCEYCQNNTLSLPY